MRTRLTLTIPETPHDDTLSHEVSADFIDERGVFTGSSTETRTFADSHGRSVTATETEFRNIHGGILMSADVTITARSEDFTVKPGENFAETFSVDVTLSLYDDSYDEYEYTLGIEGLPEWFYASGELLSADALTAGTTRHHYEFALNGMPESSMDKTAVKFTALVNVSGDVPAMRAMGRKDISITVDTVPKPPDIEPPKSHDVVPKSDDISPDIVPKSPDVVPNPPDSISTDDPGGSGTGTISLADILRNMTPEQKAAVRTLKVNSNVRDLTGLDEFTNLERLDLKEAVSLETVDLSNNSAVKSVDISGNTGLKILTLTGSKVETIDASGCENLEEVNVAGCETLRILDVSNTPITSLNAEDCTGLEVLDCSDCRLVELNISGCESLNVLDCHNNRLHMLDAYKLRRLDELICYNQRITGWRIGRVFSFVEQFAGMIASEETESQDSGVENIINLKAWDAEGSEISAEYDPDTGIATFGGEPVEIAYDYVTGFEDVKMDVTVFAAEDEGIIGVGPWYGAWYDG
ncbi:MAG: leucine-rich repeat domain-containing protein, partial [Synergistaceae bacterium]|nr:leucine-rich repeat domain-containing protein [Synergistaceae bacterium]